MRARDRILRGSRRVTALLGPTNTGKTHRAITRMLQHPSGMIGLPLRLLAREVYDRVVAMRGPESVALITGEEKRVPPHPSWFVCTVEAMPMDRPVAFVAVDEIQLAGDRNRGHVFTQRLLHARGVLETIFLGSDTIAPLIQELVPEAEIERRPRLSRLSWAGVHRLTRVPRRSAVVGSARSRSTETPSGCGLPTVGWPWCSARSRHGRAMPRWPCTKPGRSSTSWPPMRSEWA